MTRIQTIWSWATVVLGVLVLVLTYVDAANIGVWFDDHGQPDNISSAPQIALGLLGLVLIAGGLLTAWRGRLKSKS